jgi:mono/diheme cytochrome c family protein
MRKLSIVLLALAVLGPAARADKTERTWQAKCASCHGDDGKGATAKGKEMNIGDMSSAGWQKARTDEQLEKGINEGLEVMKDGKKQQMDAYKDKLRPEQVKDLVKYVRGLAGK